MGKNKLVHFALKVKVFIEKLGQRFERWINILQARLGLLLGQNINTPVVIVTGVGGTQEGESDYSTRNMLDENFKEMVESGQIQVAIQRSGLVLDSATGRPLRYQKETDATGRVLDSFGHVATAAENHLWAFLVVLLEKDLVLQILKETDGILMSGNGDNILNYVKSSMVGMIRLSIFV